MKTINYCDSSALVKRYLNEFGSAWMQVRSNDINHVIATADISRAEIAAAFAAKRRGGFISQPEYDEARRKLADDGRQRYQLIQVTSQRIDEAIELTAHHRLRGYDAVHLACALYLNQTLLAADRSPLVLVAADDDLLKAAEAEGLKTENPNLHP